jgi:hypothetical protein
MTNDLEKRSPEDTVVRFSYVPTPRAVLALDHTSNRPRAKVRTRRAASLLLTSLFTAVIMASVLGTTVRTAYSFLIRHSRGLGSVNGNATL